MNSFGLWSFWFRAFLDSMLFGFILTFQLHVFSDSLVLLPHPCSFSWLVREWPKPVAYLSILNVGNKATSHIPNFIILTSASRRVNGTSYNIWAGANLSKDRSYVLVIIFAKDNYVTTAILFDVKIERSHRLVSFLPSLNGAGSSSAPPWPTCCPL